MEYELRRRVETGNMCVSDSTGILYLRISSVDFDGGLRDIPNIKPFPEDEITQGTVSRGFPYPAPRVPALNGVSAVNSWGSLEINGRNGFTAANRYPMSYPIAVCGPVRIRRLFYQEGDATWTGVSDKHQKLRFGGYSESRGGRGVVTSPLNSFPSHKKKRISIEARANRKKALKSTPHFQRSI